MFKSFGVLVLKGLSYFALYLVRVILEMHLRTNLDIYVLSYVTLFQCSVERTQKTGLTLHIETVFIVSTKKQMKDEKK
jgi:hypothetical protein